MSRLPSALLFVLVAACAAAEGSIPDDAPCSRAESMRRDALRRLPAEMACEVDADCVVIRTEIDCENAMLGDCGTLVNRTVERDFDWPRIEHKICQAVEGTRNGCGVNAACVALEAPRCEQGVCKQQVATTPSKIP